MSILSKPLNPQDIYFRVHQTSESNRTPIVFLHGLMGFSANWGKAWPLFQNERPVLVLDQRGHGKSAKPQAQILLGDENNSQQYAPENYAADLKNLLDHLGWKKIHLVGHSMGGRVALLFAHLYPEYTQTLIMEDSGAEARPDRLDWIKNLIAKTPTPFPDYTLAKKFFDEHYANDPLVGGFLRANLQAAADGTLDWRFHAPGMIETIEFGRAVDAMEIFKSIVKPILLIRGALSEELGADEAERMRDSNNHARLITISDTGHFVHTQQPAAFAAAVREFIEGNE